MRTWAVTPGEVGALEDSEQKREVPGHECSRRLLAAVEGPAFGERRRELEHQGGGTVLVQVGHNGRIRVGD